MSLFRRRVALPHGPGVLFLLPSAEDGEATREALEVIGAISRAGWRAVVGGADGSAALKVAALGVPHRRLDMDRRGPWRRARAARRLAAMVRRDAIDVVHATTPAATDLAVTAVRGSRCAIVATIRSADALPDPETLHGVARIIVPSEVMADAVARQSGADAGRLRLVRPWIDPAQLDPDAVRGHRVAALAERWAIPAGPRIVAVPDSLALDRGHLPVIAALQAVQQQDFILLVLTELAPGHAALRQLEDDLAAAGLAERARFGRRDDDLPAALALVDLVLYAPQEAPSSTRLIAAAQAMGRPVVVSASGALGEALMPSVSGWLVPPDDVPEIARAVDLAFSLSAETRDRVARRARAFAVQRFAAATEIERQLEVYRELVDKAAPVRGEACVPVAARSA